MHIKDIDLNLLRLFDAVYRTRNVSRAAELLDLTQPAVSQGLTRLRLLVKDPLFMRAPGGVQPSPKADRLADAVRSALSTIEQAFNESVQFEPLQSRKTFRIHMSDIGESRFLPALMMALRECAPGVRVETSALSANTIGDALDSGRIDFAIGFLPTVKETQRVQLLKDRYVVLLRAGHPFVLKFNRRKRSGTALLEDLRQLEFVAVRTHSDTLRILQLLQLEDRLRLTTEHFMVLPAIVRATDLAVVMPRNIARGFAEGGGYAIIEPAFPLRDFTVSLHWSKRFESDPGNHWMLQTLSSLFVES
ncbi:MAG: LysR family transcriptional regulator [Rhodoferax sp.]|uniref:LysR family transcriptional regulator n=1 Tax=Rhodoferax sp. TaxID=50421 RepID=UPI002717CAEB|nr:LysR family transcriptional regulator [Rhodoferax sp.]MDO8447485.1 LysR family transcriptional regulator [Rhodoferax sp.]